MASLAFQIGNVQNEVRGPVQVQFEFTFITRLMVGREVIMETFLTGPEPDLPYLGHGPNDVGHEGGRRDVHQHYSSNHPLTSVMYCHASQKETATTTKTTVAGSVRFATSSGVIGGTCGNQSGMSTIVINF